MLCLYHVCYILMHLLPNSFPKLLMFPQQIHSDPVSIAIDYLHVMRWFCCM